MNTETLSRKIDFWENLDEELKFSPLRDNNDKNILTGNSWDFTTDNSLNLVSQSISDRFSQTNQNSLPDKVKISDFEHASVCGCTSCCGISHTLGANKVGETTFDGEGQGMADENVASFSASDFKWSQPGGLGSSVDITYSYTNLLNGNIKGLDSAQIQTAIEEAFGVWSSVAPLNFTEVEVNSNSQILIGSDAIDGRGNTLAFAYFPTNGDITFDNGETWSENLFLETAVHEIGHSLGLYHENSTDAIMNPSIKNRYNGLGSAFLLSDDIQGIRNMYGSGQGSVKPLNDTLEPEPEPEPEPAPEPEPEPTPSNPEITGTSSNDVLVGDERNNFIKGFNGNDNLQGGNGIDTIEGGIGSDTIAGENGSDILNGGAGADSFVFNSPNEGVDFIQDYSYSQGDRLKISYSGFDLASGGQFTYQPNSGDLFFNDTRLANLENKPTFNEVASGFEAIS